jgi:GT2 family glycosyltransferase
MDVSVVVPTFNRRKIVGRCLDTLFAQSVSPDAMEIIVVVDGSTDDTAEALRALHPACGFTVIEQENRGLAGARNTGYRAAAADLVLFLDDDMLCDRNLVASHIAAHRQGERIVAFGALFLSADSVQNLAAECFHREIGALHLEHKRNPGTDWHATDCVFSNSSISRALLAETGGFDEDFRMREDLELGVRLFGSRVRAEYLPGAVAYQHYDKNAVDLIRDAEAFAVADARLAEKHPSAQIPGHVAWLRKQSGWKNRLRRMAATFPALSDAALAPVCFLGEACIKVQFMRNLGVRALQMRRRVHWLNRLIRLGAIT